MRKKYDYCSDWHLWSHWNFNSQIYSAIPSVPLNFTALVRNKSNVNWETHHCNDALTALIDQIYIFHLLCKQGRTTKTDNILTKNNQFGQICPFPFYVFFIAIGVCSYTASVWFSVSSSAGLSVTSSVLSSSSSSGLVVVESSSVSSSVSSSSCSSSSALSSPSSVSSVPSPSSSTEIMYF